MREYPASPALAVGAVILDAGRVLLVQRANEPGRGQWSVPGGAVELGETMRQAACREAQEECGVEIQPATVLDLYDLIERDQAGRIRFHYVIIHLAAHYLSGQAQPNSDALAVGWFTEAELEDLDMPDRLRTVVRHAFHQSTGAR